MPLHSMRNVMQGQFLSSLLMSQQPSDTGNSVAAIQGRFVARSGQDLDAESAVFPARSE